MPDTFHWKLANPEAALKLISNDPLEKSSIDAKPIGLELEPSLSFGGDGKGTFALNVRGVLTVAALNDPTDSDEDGILSASKVETASGTLPPQLNFDRLYLKYRVECGVKASGDVPIGSMLGIDVSADASAIFADYRVHDGSHAVRAAVTDDLQRHARFVTRLEDVLSLAPGEALAFRFNGSLSAGLTLTLSDLFTGQIGTTLGKRLEMSAPIAISFKAGATLAFKATVLDDFLVVFSRVDDGRWRLGVRKTKSSRIAPSADAGISVGIEDPKALQQLTQASLDGVLGAPLAKVKSVLEAASLESLGTVERRIATALISRLGLKETLTTIETLRDRVADVEDKIADTIADVVKTRLTVSFAYEYTRVSLNTNLVQATLDRAAVERLHADAVKGRTETVAQAIRNKTPGVNLELYLNQKEITRAHSWGFTLGIGKWVSIGGKDFKKTSTVQRFDVQGRVQEAYLGARSYKGSWIGETFEWGVDLKADMKDYVVGPPLVSDYSLGIHLLWAATQKDLSALELEQWIDSAILWRVLRNEDAVDVRGRIAAALGKEATLSVQLTIPNTAVRSALPVLADAPLAAFAPALAASMPWMNTSGRVSASVRRQLYAPLWAAYLGNPLVSQKIYADMAMDHLQKAGHTETAVRERLGASGTDPFSFGGLIHINDRTRQDCEAFTRGAAILNSAITSGARNQKTIDKAVAEMDDFWAQSHHVRAIGWYLLDAIERKGFLDNVTRTMTVESKGLPDVVVTV